MDKTEQDTETTRVSFGPLQEMPVWKKKGRTISNGVVSPRMVKGSFGVRNG